MATVHCGQSGGQWTVHQVVDSLADSLADAVVVYMVAGLVVAFASPAMK